MSIRSFVVSALTMVFAIACFAGGRDAEESLRSVFVKYLSPHTLVLNRGKPSMVQGDFNGDGLADVAAVFLPVADIAAGDRLHVSSLRHSLDSFAAGKYHRSLVIFHGGEGGWTSHVARVFVLLDDSGALETPSFALLVSRMDGKNHTGSVSELPPGHRGDVMVLPTEAGIDTYVYWDKAGYKLLVPEEVP